MKIGRIVGKQHFDQQPAVEFRNTNSEINQYGQHTPILLTLHGPLTRYVNCGLRMRQECQERFPRHRFHRKPLVNYPGMHRGTCMANVGIANMGGE